MTEPQPLAFRPAPPPRVRALLPNLIVFALCFTAVAGIGQAQNPTKDPGLAAVLNFLKLAGWSQALNVQTATATGVLDLGDGSGPHSITLKADRSGRFSSEIPDLKVHALASVTGGVSQSDGKRSSISIAESIQTTATPAIPIFTPLAEVGNKNVLIAFSGADQSTTIVSLAKDWNSGDGLDKAREGAGLMQLSFDNATHLLRSISYPVAFPIPKANRPIRRIEYSNYQVVSGIALPLTIKEYLNGQLTATVNWTSIALNVPLGDSDFSMPEVQQ